MQMKKALLRTRAIFSHLFQKRTWLGVQSFSYTNKTFASASITGTGMRTKEKKAALITVILSQTKIKIWKKTRKSLTLCA